MFPHVFLRRILFIYQQEMYMTDKMLSYAFSQRVFSSPEILNSLDWTKKVKVFFWGTLLVSALSFVSFEISVFHQSSWGLFIIMTLFFVLLHYLLLPLYLIMVKVLFDPIDIYLKKQIVQKAKKKLQGFSDLIIIGVAGSYGKTTVKDLLCHVLSKKYKVIKTELSKNTPLGIAEAIDKITTDHQIFIVEMGEMYQGDVLEIAEFVNPKYGIITGINEQHLERFQTFDNIIATINELSAFVPDSGCMWGNGDCESTTQSLPQFSSAPISFFSNTSIDSQQYLQTGKQKIVYKGHVIQSLFIADYYPSLVDVSFQIGKFFEMKELDIIEALESFEAVDRRMNPQYFKDINTLVIDDTYNGNMDGVKHAIQTLLRFPQRKVYVTAGLKELGAKEESSHVQLGKWLAESVDEVWLVEKSVTPFIMKGLISKGFNTKNIKIFETQLEIDVFCEEKRFEKNHVYLFQNRWSDNYF